MKEKLKAKLKSYGFWVSMASAVMAFLNTLGLEVDIPYLSQVTTAFLSILVIAGFIGKPGEPPAATESGAQAEQDGESFENGSEEEKEDAGALYMSALEEDEPSAPKSERDA